MTQPYLGEIRLFSYVSLIPKGWAACDGTILPVTQNTALAALLGDAYGGDGIQTFGLPDLRGRAIAGVAAGDRQYARGTKAGAETVTLTLDQLQTHNHRWQASYSTANTPRPNLYCASQPVTDALYGQSSPDANVTLNSGVVSPAGQGAAHPNMQPYLVGMYCIATTGMYPSRN